MSLRLLLLPLCVAALLAGCSAGGSDDEPGPVATDEDIARAQLSTGFAAYWLGLDVAGRPVTSISATKTVGTAHYGKQYCDPGSGCSWNISAYTGPHRELPESSILDGRSARRCWGHLGKAVTFACPWSDYLVMWTGPAEFAAEGVSTKIAAKAVQPMNATARRLGFVRPVRFTCADVVPEQGVERSADYRRLRESVPDELAPRGC